MFASTSAAAAASATAPAAAAPAVAAAPVAPAAIVVKSWPAPSGAFAPGVSVAASAVAAPAPAEAGDARVTAAPPRGPPRLVTRERAVGGVSRVGNLREYSRRERESGFQNRARALACVLRERERESDPATLWRGSRISRIWHF